MYQVQQTRSSTDFWSLLSALGQAFVSFAIALIDLGHSLGRIVDIIMRLFE